MENRSLLELAAKASGFSYIDVSHYFNWNPIDEDGDAFSLAVKLNLTIVQDVKDKICCVHWTDVQCVNVPWGDDKYVATRLAIVKAAALIGKSLA